MEVDSGMEIMVAEKLIGNSLSSGPKFSNPGMIGGAEKPSKSTGVGKKLAKYGLECSKCEIP